MNQANKNFVTNVLHLIVNVLVGLIYTPYLVKNVGIVAYGVVPLALVINQYINVISLSLVNALTRFYSIEYRGGNFKKASSYFTTSVFVCILFAIFLYPILHIGIAYIDRIFDIPTDLLIDAEWLFRFTISAFFISIISNCINTTLFADNLLDYANYTKIARQLSKVLINIGLFVLLGNNIRYIGVANLASELIVLLMSVYYFYKTKPQDIKFSLRLYRKDFLYSLLGMVVWVLVQRFADTFLYKVDSFLMNVYFGIKMTGIIGATSEFGTYVTSIAGVLSSLFSPLLLIAYSKRIYSDYREMTVEGAYIVGLFSGLLCGMLCGSASILLSLWLGDDFSSYGLWMILKLVVVPYMTVGSIFSNSYMYANYNKWPALVSLGIAVLNVSIIILILHIWNSVLLFLVVCMVFILLQALLMNVLFYNYLNPGQLRRIGLLIFKFTLYMFLIYGLTYLCVLYVSIDSLVQLLLLYALVFILGIVILDCLFMTHTQRQLLFKIVPVYKKIRCWLIR